MSLRDGLMGTASGGLSGELRDMAAGGSPPPHAQDAVAVGESAASGRRKSATGEIPLNPTTSLPDQGDGGDIMHILSNDEGFEIMVFLPQLIMRLCPPLMLLQLIPDFRPRADHVTLSLGVSAVSAGVSQSAMHGCGVLATLMACPAVLRGIFSPWCRAAGYCVLRRGQREGYGKPHKMKLVAFAIGIFVTFWSIEGEEVSLDGQRCEQALGSCVAAMMGVVMVLAVVADWLAWAIYWLVWRDSSGGPDEFKTKASTWSKPNWTPLSGLFVERFPLGELQISDDAIKRCLSGSRWKDEVKIALDKNLFKADKLVRFQEICSETDTRWGELRPTRVQKIVNVHAADVGENGSTWALKWERYNADEHEQLHLSVKYDLEKGIRLKKAAAHEPADSTHGGAKWRHQGGDYTAGYRVAGPNQTGEDDPRGDYINSLTSISNNEPGRLEYTQQSAEQLSKRKLVHVDEDTRGSHHGQAQQPQSGFSVGGKSWWFIAMPSVRTTISSGGMSYDRNNFTTQFEAEQVGDESWLVTGPPSGTNAEWTRVNTRGSPAMAQQFLGVSRPASPEVGQQAAEPEPEPEPNNMTLKVHGFVRAEYEIVFPRRLDLTFQHWLGATVRASDHVEFQILQV
jgi:hypothetical protein